MRSLKTISPAKENINNEHNYVPFTLLKKKRKMTESEYTKMMCDNSMNVLNEIKDLLKFYLPKILEAVTEKK